MPIKSALLLPIDLKGGSGMMDGNERGLRWWMCGLRGRSDVSVLRKGLAFEMQGSGQASEQRGGVRCPPTCSPFALSIAQINKIPVVADVRDHPP